MEGGNVNQVEKNKPQIKELLLTPKEKEVCVRFLDLLIQIDRRENVTKRHDKTNK